MQYVHCIAINCGILETFEHKVSEYSITCAYWITRPISLAKLYHRLYYATMVELYHRLYHATTARLYHTTTERLYHATTERNFYRGVFDKDSWLY